MSGAGASQISGGLGRATLEACCETAKWNVAPHAGPNKVSRRSRGYGGSGQVPDSACTGFCGSGSPQQYRDDLGTVIQGIETA